MADTRVAVVTGANRGIGLAIVAELARQGLTVVLTARDAQKGTRRPLRSPPTGCRCR